MKSPFAVEVEAVTKKFPAVPIELPSALTSDPKPISVAKTSFLNDAAMTLFTTPSWAGFAEMASPVPAFCAIKT